MGDAAEGLIDADLRIQERMEELEQERRAARRAGPAKDPIKVRELESCRLAHIELTRQLESVTHPVRRDQLTAAVAELERRMQALA
ncbi:MAG: hypothetical protein R2745_14300 [Vicinamibacterales bacterium]